MTKRGIDEEVRRILYLIDEEKFCNATLSAKKHAIEKHIKKSDENLSRLEYEYINLLEKQIRELQDEK